jgi:hypothetical protein
MEKVEKVYKTPNYLENRAYCKERYRKNKLKIKKQYAEKKLKAIEAKADAFRERLKLQSVATGTAGAY